jgi:hypothetical protein
VVSPDGAVAWARVGPDGAISVDVACGPVLDEVVLRSYAVGAAHQALGWVTSEGLGVDEAGMPHASRLLERRHATSATRPSSERESAGERRAEAEIRRVYIWP